MMRKPGWEERLQIWAATRLGCAFEWGSTDCAMLCAEAVDAITGSHYAAFHRGKWASPRAAIRYQRKLGNDLAGELARAGVFRWNGIPIFGDLLLHPHPELSMMAGHVCMGEQVLTASPMQNVYLARTVDVLHQPGAFVMRIA